jgi:serine/threonine protein kinase
MNPERWGEIKRIFEEAADLPPQEQAEFVRGSSGGDSEIEAEALRLLCAIANTGRFMERPIADIHDFVEPHRDEPFLSIGTVIAKRFNILRFLNRGGMGEVYEAWDAELNETVALKTIRPEIASDAEATERFKREVKQAREVSHPNICRVHELFCHDTEPGQRMWFLSMELLPGSTLLECIRTDGPVKPFFALSVTEQMVSGLNAAHLLGLVHRDFKSSNVILVPGAAGHMRAVITDFGLSLRMLRPAGGLAEPGGMGTPGYMAPEQEADGEVGPLADQYALGAVMCEMLTGSLPRWSKPKGPEEKAVLELPEHRLTPRWEDVIRRCLQREPENRFPQIEDVSKALVPPGILGTPRRIAAAVLLTVGMAAGGILWMKSKGRCQICNVAQLTPDTDESESPSLARNSHSIVYSSDRADTGNLDIFLQKLPGGQPVRLTRDTARDGDPSISPDGAVIAFRSEREGGGIYLTDDRGVSERLVVPHGRNPQISPDGKSLLYWTGDPDPYVASGKIFLSPLLGGEPVQIAKEFQDARFPVWSPGGGAILFTGCETTEKTLPGCSDWWVVSTYGKRIVNTHIVERLRGDGITLSRPGDGFWNEAGLVFSGGSPGLPVNLWRIALDPQTWRVLSGPKQLLKEDARDVSPSIGADGSIAYARISGSLHVWRVDHANNPGDAALSKITQDADIDGSPYVSEGGRWLVFARGRGNQRSIWIRDNLTQLETQLVNSGMPTQSPVVDESGEILAYEQLENGGTSIYTKMQGGPAKRLCRGCSRPTGWFSTNRTFLYRDGLPSVIKMADPRTGEARVVLQEKGASLSEASWSSANEMMLFTETKGDLKRMFAVRVSRSSGEVGGNWIAIPDRGVSPDHPRWSGDGRTIFYISNSDGFSCIYGLAFSPEKGEVVGAPFAVAHFHNQRASIDNVFARSLNLSVDGNSIYFNLGEQSSTIWIGMLAKH